MRSRKNSSIRLLRRDLDDARQHVEAREPAVAPQRAGLEIERHGAELRNVGGERVLRRALRRLVRDALTQAAAHEPRAVLQEIGDRDRPRRGHEIERAFGAARLRRRRPAPAPRTRG